MKTYYCRSVLSNLLSIARVQTNIYILLILFFFQISFIAKVQAADIILQAENGTLTGVSTASTEAGYTGTGYVNGATFDADGDNILVSTTISAAGSYQLKIRYSGVFGEKYQEVYINGVSIGLIHFPASTGWVEKDLGLRAFNAGNNTIEVRHSYGWMHVDNFTVVGAVPSAIPGTIQAESYTTMSGIQTETTTDAGGGQNVGWIDANDWMDYNVNVATSGTYTVSFRVASGASGGNLVLKKGTATLCTITVPATGGWQTWTTVNATASLVSGTQTLRLTTTTGGINVNWLQFAVSPPVVSSAATASGTVGTAFSYSITASNNPTSYGASGLPAGLSVNTTTGVISGTPSAAGTFNSTVTATNAGGTGSKAVTITVSIPIPGTMQAESYTTMSGIQTETCTDTGGGLNVGYFETNDWLDYNVNVGTSGTYTVSFRVASESTGGNLVLKNGTTTLCTITVPATGGWQTWTTVNGTASLTAGVHTLRLTTTTGGINVNWLQFAGGTSAPVVSSAGTASGALATAFSYSITASNSPTSYGASGLPAGLSVNTTTGVISGIPSAAGTFNSTVTATNAGGTGSKALTITISAIGIPGTMQAESYTAMSGIQTETCTDTGGGLNVGYFETNDWLDYNVNVAASGTYTVSFRVASELTGGNLVLKNGTATLSTITVPVTGGWQTWTTVNGTVSLTAGAQTLRLTTTTGGINVNWLQFMTGGATSRITVSGTNFMVGSNRIWLNGANTPWNNWDDFGGNFNAAWWETHFQVLQDNGINSTRVWITCSPENQAILISDVGFVSGASALFWSHVDQLMQIAQAKKIYVMMALISFDHTKNVPVYPSFQRYRNMMASQANVNSFADNFVKPLVQRYNNNPYLFSIDVCNEIIWMHEDLDNAQFAWPIIQYYIAKVSATIHENSQILATVGDYAKYTCPKPSPFQGNKYSNAALQAQYNNPNAYLDFYKIHYYSWVGRWFGVHVQQTPTELALTDKPIVIGEISANGVYTQNESNQDVFVMSTTQGYETAFQNGWQGVMAWTSNAVDGNGGINQLGPATQAFKNAHFSLVYPNGSAGRLASIESEKITDESNDNYNYVLYPNPSNTQLNIIGPGEFQVEIFDNKGSRVFEKSKVTHSVTLSVENYESGMFMVRINNHNGVTIKKFIKK